MSETDTRQAAAAKHLATSDLAKIATAVALVVTSIMAVWQGAPAPAAPQRAADVSVDIQTIRRDLAVMKQEIMNVAAKVDRISAEQEAHHTKTD